jgi:hypothetical protein
MSPQQSLLVTRGEQHGALADETEFEDDEQCDNNEKNHAKDDTPSDESPLIGAPVLLTLAIIEENHSIQRTRCLRGPTRVVLAAAVNQREARSKRRLTTHPFFLDLSTLTV